MAEKRISFKIEVDDKGSIVKLTSLDSKFKDIDLSSKKASNAVKSLTTSLNNMGAKIGNGAKVKLASSEIKNLNQQLGATTAATGSATSSVLEMGRAISDAPYGIRGVANNLSQLASNMAFTAKQAGGLGAGIKEIGKAMMGPLGVLLLIQTGIALLEAWSNSTKKANDLLGDLASEGVTETAIKYELLRQTLNNTTISLNEKNLVIAKAKEENKDLNITLDEQGILTEASNQAMIDSISIMEKTAKAKAILAVVTEEYAKQARLEVTDPINNLEWYEKAFYGAGSSFGAGGVAMSYAAATNKGLENRNDKIKESAGIVTRLKEMLTSGKDEDFLLQYLFGDTKKGGSRRKEAEKIYKQAILDLQKFVLGQEKETVLLIEENEREELIIKHYYQKEDLKATRDAYFTKNKLAYEHFLKKAKTQKERDAAEKTYTEANRKSEEEYNRANDALDLKQIEERNKFEQDLQEKHLAAMRTLKMKSSEADLRLAKDIYGTEAGKVGSPVSKAGAEGIDELVEQQRATNEVKQRIFEENLEIERQRLINTGLAVEDVEAQIFETKYQNELERAQREIDIEEMKIDAKRNINMEYVSWVSSLGSTFKAIAGGNEDLAKAALVLEKGSAIAGVVISTQAANAKIIAGTASEQAGYSAAAGATALIPAASSMYQKMAIAAGIKGKQRILKNNIGAGLSIANILATSLQSKGGGGGASGAGGGGESQNRTFDFNLVGSTGVNQLVQGVGGQLSTPIQAYVVESQITSQQQLTNVIQSNATIG